MTRFAKSARIVTAFCGIVLGGWGTPAIHAQNAVAGSPETVEAGAAPVVPVLPPTSTRSTAMVSSYRPEEINPGDFILPFGRPFTKEQRKQWMQLPGVKIVRSGPKGTPFYTAIRYILEPWDDHQFRINLSLERTIMPLEEAEGVVEVGRKLKAARIENPGRAKSFPVWATVEYPGLPSIPLIHSGWSLTVEKVETRIDDWRAWVTVMPILRTDDYEEATALDRHYEVYLYKDGKLTLEKDAPDPKRTDDPVKGVRAFIKGRGAPFPAAPKPPA